MIDFTFVGMKTLVIQFAFLFVLSLSVKAQGLPIEIGSDNGILSFQYSDSSYNYYNSCNVTRLQTFERYPNILWVYILEGQNVRVEKIDVSVLYSPYDKTVPYIVDFVSNTIGDCLSSVEFVTEKFYEGWFTTLGVWRTNNKSWLVN